jgi:Bacterial antitoxin of type II TA system, VapB
MRTNIEIDDKLMKQAMKACGAATKKAAVEAGLALLVKSYAQQGIRKWFGKLEMDPDYDHKAMRVSDKWNGSPLTWEEEAKLPRPEGSKVTRGARKKAA